jgi:soluble lytic murein transglycosylase-like protein
MKYILIILFINTTYALSIDKCFNIASKEYQIPSKLLRAIAKTETNLDSQAIHINSNHSYDLGIMQINSSWLATLNKVGISRIDLLNGCTNIQVGAWILAQNIKRYGFSQQALGAYHSATPVLQQEYAQLVLRNLK